MKSELPSGAKIDLPNYPKTVIYKANWRSLMQPFGISLFFILFALFVIHDGIMDGRGPLIVALLPFIFIWLCTLLFSGFTGRSRIELHERYVTVGTVLVKREFDWLDVGEATRHEDRRGHGFVQFDYYGIRKGGRKTSSGGRKTFLGKIETNKYLDVDSNLLCYLLNDYRAKAQERASL